MIVLYFVLQAKQVHCFTNNPHRTWKHQNYRERFGSWFEQNCFKKNATTLTVQVSKAFTTLKLFST